MIHYRGFPAGWILLALTLAAGSRAQSRVDPVYGLRVRIIAPSSSLRDVTVYLHGESLQPIAEVTVRPYESFLFSGLSAGRYALVTDVPGFKSVRQTVDVNGPDLETFADIFLEEKNSLLVEGPADFSGEENNIVDASDLTFRSPELIAAIEDSQTIIDEGRYNEARLLLEPIVKEHPTFYEARKTLGLTYQKIGLYREAETEYRAARDLRPSSAAPLILLGSLYVQQADSSASLGTTVFRGILNDALENLLMATELNPQAPFGHYLLGVTYYKAEFYEDAEDQLRRAIELEPRFAETHLALANVYISLQEWHRALEQIDAYLENDSRDSDRKAIRDVRARIQQVLDRETATKPVP